MTARALRASSAAGPEALPRTACVAFAQAAAASTLCVLLTAHAEPGSAELARSAADMTTAALQRDAVVVAPEVSATRTPASLADEPRVAPGGRATTELADVQLRLWMWRGRTGLALGVGALSHVQPLDGPHADGAVTVADARPTVSVGMRYRMTRDSAVFADASGVRAWPSDNGGGYLRTNVGMEWKPAGSRFGFDRGMLGVHFDSGYRLSFKARRDGLGIYLRGQF